MVDVVYLLDDNTRGKSRVDELCDALEKEGLEAVHFATFTAMREAHEAGEIDPNALFVLDNTIVEPGKRAIDFTTTVPALLDWGVDPDHMLPASSAFSGSEVNTELFPALLRKTMLRDGQDTFAYGGFENLDPQRAATQLKSYYNELRMGGGEGWGPLR